MGGLVGLSTFSLEDGAKRSTRRACVAGLPGVFLIPGWSSLFLALVGGLLLSGSLHLRSKKGLQMVTVVAVVLFSSWIQALTEYGENPRYGITVQPLVVLFVLNMVHAYWKGEGKPAKQAESPSSK